MDYFGFFHTLSEKNKQILIGSTSVIGGFVLLIGYFLAAPNALVYAKAEAAFAKWQSSDFDEGLYKSVKEAMRLAPALEKKYEASIAQKLLNTEKIQEALAMANRSLQRVQETAPFHAAFAKTSLLIEQSYFQQALENAVALKEQMGQSYQSTQKGGSLLYAHNLLRIAFLQQELRNRPGEKAAWEQLESFLETKSILAETLLSNFTAKKVDLIQYIVERKKYL